MFQKNGSVMMTTVDMLRKYLGHAERAIEDMQGFPLGGSRIRLSWGRSRCKSSVVCSMLFLRISADKATQAAQAVAVVQAKAYAVLQPQATPITALPQLSELTREQAIEFALGPQINPSFSPSNNLSSSGFEYWRGVVATSPTDNTYPEDKMRAALLSLRQRVGVSNQHQHQPNPSPPFAQTKPSTTALRPLSSDPNMSDGNRGVVPQMGGLPYHSTTYIHGFYPETVVALTDGAEPTAASPLPASQLNELPGSILRPAPGHTHPQLRHPISHSEYHPERDLNATLPSFRPTLYREVVEWSSTKESK